MFAPSTILWPLLSVLAARSLPARSIIWSLDFVWVISAFSFLCFDYPSILNISIACDRELNLLAPVLATNRLRFPKWMRSISSEASATGISCKFWTMTPFTGSSTILRFWVIYFFELWLLNAFCCSNRPCSEFFRRSKLSSRSCEM